jgi:hypothetical protein
MLISFPMLSLAPNKDMHELQATAGPLTVTLMDPAGEAGEPAAGTENGTATEDRWRERQSCKKTRAAYNPYCTAMVTVCEAAE